MCAYYSSTGPDQALDRADVDQWMKIRPWGRHRGSSVSGSTVSSLYTHPLHPNNANNYRILYSVAMRGFITRLSLAHILPARPFLLVYPNPRAVSFQSRLCPPKFPPPSASRRSFHSSPILRYKRISSEIILYELKYRKIEKWGWVFYRTTYKDDEAWDIFKQKVNISVSSIINLDPPIRNQ